LLTGPKLVDDLGNSLANIELTDNMITGLLLATWKLLTTWKLLATWYKSSSHLSDDNYRPRKWLTYVGNVVQLESTNNSATWALL